MCADQGGGRRRPPPTDAVRCGVVAVSGAVRPSLDDGKNNSRAADAGESRQSDAPARYDCRHVYANMEHESADGATAPFRCDSWDCYCCAHRMRMNLIEELERLIDERPELRRFLTLTVDPALAPDDGAERHRYLTERFNALRTELRDSYGDLSYVWFREEQESGNPHLHLLVDRYLPQSELSAMADRVGLGRIVDIRRVEARNAAKYATKYLTKGAMAELPDGIRRYGSSADVDLDVRGGGDGSGDWTLMMDDYALPSRDSPLRRRVTKQDLAQQREWDGPVPPDAPDPPPAGD